MLYSDRFIQCDESELRIRFYYFPFGTRRIPYSRITEISTFELTATGGKLRIWGTANLRYWASLDPRRPSKEKAITLATGGSVKALITPDDPDRVLEILTQRSGLPVTETQAPFV